MTIDSEVDEILDDLEINILGIKYDMESDEPMRIAEVNEHITAIKKLAAQNITNLIAQEANKAELKGMEAVNNCHGCVDNEPYLDERRQELIRLTADKGGARILPHKRGSIPTITDDLDIET